MMTKTPVATVDSAWKNLYRVGAIAALLAALVFRRNLAAEIIMLTGQSAPTNAAAWFTLLHDNSLLGLSFLNVFDIVDYVLVGIMFLALYAALRKTNKSYMAIATSLCFVGIAVYIVSNTAFSMLSLSSQYASATTSTQRSALLAAGQAVLVKGDPGAGYEGVGGYISFFLIAAAGLMVSVVMLRSKVFNRATGYVGIAASALNLAYIFGLAFLPETAVEVWSLSCIATAGLLLMIWHLLVGIKLYKLGRTIQVKGGVSS